MIPATHYRKLISDWRTIIKSLPDNKGQKLLDLIELDKSNYQRQLVDDPFKLKVDDYLKKIELENETE